MKGKVILSLIMSAMFAFPIMGCNDSGNPPQDIDTRKETAVENLVTSLSNGYYSKNLKTSDFCGLTDPSVVGAKQKNMSDVRYPVPSDKEFAHVYNVADSGILPTNTDNSGALNILLKSLKTVDGLKKVYFPAGVYKFSATINVTSLKDVYLVGEDTVEFMMTEWTEAVVLKDSENIHFNQIDFDYLVSSTVTGKVVSANDDNKTVTVKINDGFDMTDYRYNGGKIKYGNFMEFIQDSRTGDYFPNSNGMLVYNSTGDQVNMIENGVYNATERELTLTFGANYYKRPQVNSVVSVGYTMYENFTIKMDECKDFYMESCNIYSSVGMTFGFYSSENIYLNRTNVVLRDGSNKLMTATADGLHTNDCLGDLFVSNSIIENTHDDAINVCTFYKKVTAVSGNVITCTAPNAAANFPTKVGDKLEIYNGETMEIIKSYTVTDVASYGLVYEITVDKRVRDVEEGHLVGNLTRTPKLVVENCVFRNKRNRGILCQTQNSVIKNCSFYNIIHGSISLHAAFDGFFNEGLIPRNVTVEGCKFINNQGSIASADVFIERHGGTIVAGAIKNITVRNNFFNGNFNSGISFRGAGDCTAENNLFYNEKSLDDASNYYLASIVKSENVTLKNNLVFFANQRDEYEMVYESDASGTVLQNNDLKGVAN
ncbi:MAG: hypothetical protein E7369_06245 [Clostridiales bacterium]|nr:hypothetical protein [Clostridiales bacterium]